MSENAIFCLSDEIIERGEAIAAELKLPLDTLLSFLLEGWTNPDFFLRHSGNVSFCRRG